VDERADKSVLLEEELTHQIIGAAIEVHRFLGPGLLESAYHKCLAHELTLRGLLFKQEVPIPVVYKSVTLDCGYRADFIIAEKVVVEIKSVDAIAPVHEAQLLTYLKLTKCKVGLLINFNVPILKKGIVRRVL